MWANRTGNFRRFAMRGRYATPSWPPALPPWAEAWLAVLQQHPAARWALEYRRELAEVALYLGAYLVYVLSRGVVYDDTRAVAVFNGERIVALQEQLRFLWEPGWQAWAIEHVRGLVVFLNWAYIVTYWPVILALAIYLFLRNRREYYYYRTVVLLDLIVALLCFALFPVASPFAIPHGGPDGHDPDLRAGILRLGIDVQLLQYLRRDAQPALQLDGDPGSVLVPEPAWALQSGGRGIPGADLLRHHHHR